MDLAADVGGLVSDVLQCLVRTGELLGTSPALDGVTASSGAPLTSPEISHVADINLVRAERRSRRPLRGVAPGPSPHRQP